MQCLSQLVPCNDEGIRTKECYDQNVTFSIDTGKRVMSHLYINSFEMIRRSEATRLGV